MIAEYNPQSPGAGAALLLPMAIEGWQAVIELISFTFANSEPTDEGPHMKLIRNGRPDIYMPCDRVAAGGTAFFTGANNMSNTGAVVPDAGSGAFCIPETPLKENTTLSIECTSGGAATISAVVVIVRMVKLKDPVMRAGARARAFPDKISG